MKLYIDIETGGDGKSLTAGIHKYIDSGIQLHLVAYAIDNEPIKVIDLVNERDGDAVKELRKMLDDESITKIAHNAEFEIAVLSSALRLDLNAGQWQCTMKRAAYYKIPASLKRCAEVLGCSKKMEEGKDLIKKFAIINPDGNDPDWKTYKEYCKQDVEVLREIDEKLPEVPDIEELVQILDTSINANGIGADLELVDKLIKRREENNNKAMPVNVNSRKQVLDYAKELGYEMLGFTKADVIKALADSKCPKKLAEVLDHRLTMGNVNLKKLDKIKETVCSNGRIYDQFKYYGAAESGRWSGRGIQLQNISHDAFDDAWLQNPEELSNNQLKALIRPCLKARDNYTFIISDLAQIEARVCGWLVGDEQMAKDIANGVDLHKKMASYVYGIDIDKVSKEQRQNAKTANFACQYGSGPAGLMDLGDGLTEAEARRLVDGWRSANSLIVKYWADVERAFSDLILSNDPDDIKLVGDVAFTKSKGPRGNIIRVNLQSGRQLIYHNARFDNGNIIYDKLVGSEYVVNKTYGAQLVNNIIQGLARDVLAHKMLIIASGCPQGKIVAHVHDELVLEIDKDSASKALTYVDNIMKAPLNWAEGLEIGAETIQCERYRK